MSALGSPWAELRALPTLVRVSTSDHVAYRAEMTIWILTATLPLFMLALWNAVVRDGPLAGFGQAEMARYFTATLIVRQLTSAWVVWELSFNIRTGRLSGQLLRPLHPLFMHAVWMTTAMPFRVLILSPIVIGLVLWRPDLLAWPGWDGLAAFVLSTALALSMSFFVQCWFGALAFWIDKSDGLFGVWFSTWMIASGYVAPLEVFPAWARPILHALPFRGMLAVPVEILGGFTKPRDALPDLALQVAWTLTFAALVRFTWARGVRRYGAYGA
ncbi:MAG TPA: ABC-2 family transporter protein [Myxococcota bacterium]|nr:ABC-2 family transporter protein [Myxococcota bacterium]